MQGILVGVDVGGTFTDAFALVPATGQRAAAKAPTTPEDQGRGVVRAVSRVLDALEAAPGDVGKVVHGTTTATNAVLEHDLAGTALVTNRGFEDLLEIGRQDRPSLYDLSQTRARPLVAREDRYGITGRIDAGGRQLEALDEDELDRLGARLAERGVEAVAVCLLHSYQAPAHEARVVEVLGKHTAQGVPVVASHAVSPEFREVERFTTTVLNAGLLPRMRAYLGALSQRLQELGVQAPLSVLDSAGALMAPEEAADLPVRAVLSGPAGGAAGAKLVAEEVGAAHLLGVDMGGTSTDVTLLLDGEPTQRWEAEIGGYPLQVPTADIQTVGAGGGSVAWVDEAGGLRVGPRSAGADPGPACYGRGGEAPTLTDAHLVLGRLQPGATLGGDVRLDGALARGALEPVADRLDLAPEQAALSILEVASAHAVRGIRVLTARHAADPRELTLLAFGGAGPLHAAAWAAELGIEHVVVPPEAGVHSAVGLLAAPPRAERARTLLTTLGEEALGALEDALAELDDRARAALGDEQAGCTHLVSARYAGQSHELTVPVETLTVEAVRRGFEDAHRHQFGYVLPEDAVEVVTARSRARLDPALVPHPAGEPPDQQRPEASSQAPCWFLGWDQPVPTPRYPRGLLAPGHVLEGPAVVDGAGSTTVVPPGWRLRVDGRGTLHLAPGGVSS